MTSFLLFCLHGPMASWGDVAIGEHRPSQKVPTKSAVMGLVASALGFERSQEEELLRLDQSFDMAVLVYAAGIPAVDYHTTQVPGAKKNQFFATRKEELSAPSADLNTILSNREYRMDVHYHIALWQTEAIEKTITLEAIQRALLCPQGVLYLGRKSCPLAAPLNPRILQVPTLKEALETYLPCEKLQRSFSTSSGKEVYWDSFPESGIEPLETLVNNDRLLSRQRWQFRKRTVFRGSLQLPGSEVSICI